MAFPYEEFDVSGIHTYPLNSRKSKVSAQDFARAVERGVKIFVVVGDQSFAGIDTPEQMAALEARGPR